MRGRHTTARRDSVETKRYISYRRVSSLKQEDGWSLDHQASAVAAYAKQNNGEVVATYTEVESGTRNSRVELGKALKECKKTDAVLLVASLSRLSRNAEFLRGIEVPLPVITLPFSVDKTLSPTNISEVFIPVETPKDGWT